MLFQQPALQAALAAQCIAAQVQSSPPVVPPQTVQLLAKPLKTSNEPAAHTPSSDPGTTTQELSVAQMMMTLAQASNKQASAPQNGGNHQNVVDKK